MAGKAVPTRAAKVSRAAADSHPQRQTGAHDLRHLLALGLVAAFVSGCAATEPEKPAKQDPIRGPQAAPTASAAAADKGDACPPPPKDLVVKDIAPGTGQ